MEKGNFEIITIPPVDEAARDEIRKSAGLIGFVGRKPFTDIVMRSDLSHATDEYINYDPKVDGPEKIALPPSSGVGRRRAGVIGDISSSSGRSSLPTRHF